MDPNPVVQRAVRRRRRFLMLLVGLDVGLIVVLSSLRFDAHHPDPGFLGFAVGWQLVHPVTAGCVVAILVLQAVLGIRALYRALASADLVAVHPEDESSGVLPGGLTTPELVQMVHEVAARLGIRSVARIYLVTQPVPGAFTAHLPGAGNVVALHSNLFAFLPREGIRAVIAHEVAHMRRADSLARQVISVPAAFAFAAFSVVLLQILGGVLNPRSVAELGLRVLLLLLAAGAASFVLGMLARIAIQAAREAEHLADVQAGRLCGWEQVVNMLLLLGERTEALATLAETFGELAAEEGEEPSHAELARVLAGFPEGELSEAKARRVVPELIVRSRLEVLRERFGVPLEDGEIDRLARSAGTGESGPDPDAALTDWRAYDHDRSGDLDREELEELVEELARSPDRMLFRQFLAPESRQQDHPPVRDRILFLYRALAAEPEGGAGAA
jgi:Zn-dependent protease with chaperone function